MKKKLECIMLIDDDKDCNFLHKRLFNKMDCAESVVTMADGQQALDYLTSTKQLPELIFLDINMPRMNGWEFLEAYKLLSKEKKTSVLLVMLTSSLNPDDQVRASSYGLVHDFFQKYLTEEAVINILKKHFPRNI